MPDKSFSNDAAGTTSAVFLKNPPGARAQALGGSGLALGGTQSIFWNPAGLAAIGPDTGPSITLSYDRMLETSYRSTLAYAWPVRWGVFGAGVIFASQSPLEKYSVVGDSMGTFKPYDMALSGSFARRFGKSDFGATIKFLRFKLCDESSDSVAVDAGLILPNAGELGGAMTDVAFSVRHLGLPMKMGSKSDPLPLELGIGLLWHFYKDVEIAINGKAPVDHSPYVTLGGEWTVASNTDFGGCLRAGYNFKNASELGVMGALSAGAGVTIGSFSMDYAWVPFGDLGNTHRITIGLKYGGMGSSQKQRITKSKLPGISDKPTIAVSKISADKSSQKIAGMAVGWVTDALSQASTFRLIDRERRTELLKEHAEQLALCSGDCEVRVGRILRTDKIVFGALSVLKNNYILHLEMTDVETGKIEFSGSKTVSNLNQLKKAAFSLVKEISRP